MTIREKPLAARIALEYPDDDPAPAEPSGKPAPLAPEFVSEICGDEPLVLVRPADLLEPEYDRIREYTAPWLEGEEDILIYALYRGIAIAFFEKRKAKKYALDMPHAHKHRGIHTV